MTRYFSRCIALSLFCFFIFPLSNACGQTTPSAVEEGIRQYQQENYEEAIEILTQSRKRDPGSSTAAFFLGMAYKQTHDIAKALPQFQDAVALKPPIKEAVVELIDALIQTEKFDEAFKWIGEAEKNNIYPAKTAFLKGLIQSRQGKFAEAVASFEKSKQLDPSYAQSADFQIGVAYMSDRKYAKAKERFQAAITQDPLSDLGSYARRYQDIVEEQSFLQRPLRVTFGLMGQYDTNMLQEPFAYPGLPDAGEERSLKMTSSLRLDYVPILPGRWLFNAGYAGISTLHEKNSGTYDLLANSINVAPGYDFGRFAVNIVGNFAHILKRGDYSNNGGAYRRYAENFSVGPLFRYLLNQNNILELSGAYASRNYFKPPPVGNPGDDMTARAFDGYLSWMRIFKGGGLFNLKYGLNIDHADGAHYSNTGHRFTAMLIYPVWKKISLQASGDAYLQDYANANVFFSNKKRQDRVYSGTLGLNWNLHRNVSAIAQYAYTRANSNIFIYDYERSIFSLGVELRF